MLSFEASQNGFANALLELVQPGDERASGGSNSNVLIPTRELSRRWSLVVVHGRKISDSGIDGNKQSSNWM